MAIANVVDIVAMEIHVPPSLQIFDPDSLSVVR